MRSQVILSALFGFILAWPALAAPVPAPDLSIAQTLRMAEAASPDLRAALERERAAEQSIRLFKSLYYPDINLEVVESFGFPGSSRDLGMSGLMGSPFRSGPAAGLSADLELFDLGRTYSVRTAQKELEAIRTHTSIIRYQVDQRTLQIFLDASRFRGQEETSKEMAEDIGRVEKEVDRFVKTGQRSVVERLLVHDQTSDADMAAAEFHARYDVALQRLAVVTASSGTLSCPTPQMLSEEALGLMKGDSQSPLLLQAIAEASAAHAAISQYSAQNYPKVLATASVGDMDEARLVAKKDYSGGFGLQLPIFAGYKIDATIRQAQALASARDSDQLAVRMDIDQLNAHYDEIISGSRVKLQYLESEFDDAQKAFKLAKERYVAFQGTLVDVREALRNLSRVTTEMIDVKTDLLLAVGSRKLLNGDRIP